MPITAYYATGEDLYVRFSDGSNTAVDLTEGSSLKLGQYDAADAAIDSAGLAAGTFSARVFLGTASGQSSSDVEVSVIPEFRWDGTNEISLSGVVDASLTTYGALKPTVAGRTLDVTTTGEAGIDWSNIGAPTTTQNLSGTTIKTATDLEIVSSNILITVAEVHDVTSKLDTMLEVEVDDWKFTAFALEEMPVPSSTGGPIEQTPVPAEFTVIVPARGSTNLAGSKTLYVQASETIMVAMDFTNVLHAGDSLSEIEAITEQDGQAVTLTPIGVCGNLAKFWVSGADAGAAYRAEVRVLTRFGLVLEGDGLISTAD